MSKIIDKVLDSMDETYFFEILAWASVKAIITMTAFFIIGYFILPMFTGGNATLFAITFVSSFIVFAYVFKLDIRNFIKVIEYMLGSFVYGMAMYFFGEMIFIGMAAVGILAIIIFLMGDSALTGIYTYADLKKWVKEQTDKEKTIDTTADITTSP